MIYFTPYDHTLACAAFLFLGATFGVLYRSVNSIFDFLSSLFAVGLSVLKADSPITSKKFILDKHNKKHRNLLDLLFFLILGISFILFSYATLDGEIRIYTVLVFTASFVIFEKFLSIPVECVLRFAFEILYKIIFFLAYFITLPLKVTLKFIAKATLPYINIIKSRLYERYFNAFVKKECRKIENLFSKIK